ncbi:DUF885 domain-containing protein [Pontibacter cellulosilyticus]|uniref:DUF885 domain-containing protein n=1 Tax=Pontibacter cellulosilyticus TaxID=1720253 RepID=A0A923N1S9_9BACT|nr:DUF885 domain-containing protein [Pontibacter cellulosilyticus]MBC5991275.1 DUF885 domain-containing protein [Pontibacter cellulosilyticus]
MAASKIYTWLLCLPLLFLLSRSQPASNQDQKLQALLQNFAIGYRALNMPGVTLSYIDRLERIQDTQGLVKQEQLFKQAAADAKEIDPTKLTGKYKVYYRQLLYELDLNQRRIALEKKFKQQAKQPPTADGILYQPLGKEFYTYWLQEYLSLPVTPDELKAFGMQEVQNVKQQIRQVRRQLGYANDSAGFYTHLNSSRFILTKEKEIISRYQQKYEIVMQHLPKLFLVTDIRPLYFTKIADADKDSPPGVYAPHNTTFLFNFYRQRHNTRSMDFLLLHEGVPGHHYQSERRRQLNSENPMGNLFWYFAYSEGWAAYTEELGQELGLYQTPYEYLGKLEWDLVRSARVVMDVGLNYDGWTKEQAMAFWKEHIPNQDDIAQREIDRMLRWPVQVHTYKVGADFILKQLQQEKQQKGSDFDIRAFHEAFLKYGPLPLVVLVEEERG